MAFAGKDSELMEIAQQFSAAPVLVVGPGGEGAGNSGNRWGILRIMCKGY